MSKERKLSYKQKGFVKDLILTKNPTEAVRRNYDVVKDNTARVIAHENLTKHNVVRAIDKALTKAGLTDESVSLIHQRNLSQSDNLNVSQQAVRDYHSVKGNLDKNTDKSTVNVAFIINKA